jgi:hypothetical protein
MRQVGPMKPDCDLDYRIDRLKLSEHSLRKGPLRTHQGKNHGHIAGKCDEIADFLGQPGLDVIVPKVLALIEPVGCEVLDPKKASRTGLGASKIERVQQVGPCLILADEHPPLVRRKIIKQGQWSGRAVVSEHHDAIHRCNRAQHGFKVFRQTVSSQRQHHVGNCAYSDPA